MKFCKEKLINLIVKELNHEDREDMLLYQGVLALEYFTKTSIDKMVIESMRDALKKS